MNIFCFNYQLISRKNYDKDDIVHATNENDQNDAFVIFRKDYDKDDMIYESDENNQDDALVTSGKDHEKDDMLPYESGDEGGER